MSGSQKNDQLAGPCRDQLESAVFAALDDVYRLPTDDAVATAGLVAGQIAAFLADVAQLSGSDADVNNARRALSELICDCEELAGEIRRARIPQGPEAPATEPSSGGAAQSVLQHKTAPHKGVACADGPRGRAEPHNITQFKPRSGHRSH